MIKKLFLLLLLPVVAHAMKMRVNSDGDIIAVVADSQELPGEDVIILPTDEDVLATPEKYKYEDMAIIRRSYIVLSINGDTVSADVKLPDGSPSTVSTNATIRAFDLPYATITNYSMTITEGHGEAVISYDPTHITTISAKSTGLWISNAININP